MASLKSVATKKSMGAAKASRRALSATKARRTSQSASRRRRPICLTVIASERADNDSTTGRSPVTGDRYPHPGLRGSANREADERVNGHEMLDHPGSV